MFALLNARLQSVLKEGDIKLHWGSIWYALALVSDEAVC